MSGLSGFSKSEACTGTGSACSSSYYSENDSYDSLGRVYQRAIAIPSMGTYTYTWLYNATTGFLDTLTYPVSTGGSSFKLKYGNQNGILQSITNVLASPNVTIWQASAENPAGQITQETLGNGLVTSRAYDGVTHWLSSVESGPGGGATVQNQSSLYDEVGNVTQRQDNNRGLTENIYYDNDDRFSTSSLNGNQNLSVWIAPNGNVLRRSDVASAATWTYDPIHLHEVTEAGSASYMYAYDANGNVTSRQGSSISWSSYNYPTTINDTATGESVSFLYGPDRRAYFEQTQSSSGTETTYHVGGLLDVVTAGGVTDYRHYIYAGSELFAINSRKSSGVNALHYVLSDHQGSVAAITDSTGAVVVGESFTAYGSRRNPSTWSGAPASSDLSTIAGITRQGYTFQDALGQMGLNDMVGRVQDAVTGRFLSADPNIPDPTDPQSYNPYSYTRNNPLTYTDPSGFEDKTCDGCGGGLTQMQIDEGWESVYCASCSTYTYVTDQETAQGVGGGTETVTDVFQGDSITMNAQGGMTNLLGSYYDGQWHSSGLDEAFQGDGGFLDFGGFGFGAFTGGFDRFGGGSSSPGGMRTWSMAAAPAGAASGIQQSTQTKVCQYASSNPDASELEAVATTLGIDDNLVQAIEKADPSFSLPGFLGEAAPTLLSGAATGVAGGIIAGEVRQGEYLNATLDSMDMGLGLVASKAGGSLLFADTAFNALGGFKQLAKGAANVICVMTGGK